MKSIPSQNLAPIISILTILAVATLTSCQQPTQKSEAWTFSTSDRIHSHPTIDDDAIYFGSNDSNFYALDVHSGKELWRKKTGFKVRSQAAAKGSTVFFTSGNNLYALSKEDGNEKWVYRSENNSGSGVLDPWDYHSGSPVIHEAIVFAGFGNGLLIGFDTGNGEEIFRFQSNDSSAIRSSPVIHENAIYFGDWNGRIYSTDIKTSQPNWIYQSYEFQPYPTFGQINTRLAIGDTLLVVGARNPEMHVLGLKSGKKIWSHIEKDGGWVSGDPLISGDTVFIGGSDNHKMIAFDLHSGKILWEFTFLFNNFSLPVLHQDYLLFTTGDAYSTMGKSAGNGYLYALNRQDGSLINMAHFDGNLFNTPVLFENKIIIGGDDNLIRTLDLKTFLEKPQALRNGTGPFYFKEMKLDSLTGNAVLTYAMDYEAELSIYMLNLDRETLRMLHSGTQEAGEHEVIWNGQDDDGKIVPRGYYLLESKSGIYMKNTFVPFGG